MERAECSNPVAGETGLDRGIRLPCERSPCEEKWIGGPGAHKAVRMIHREIEAVTVKHLTIAMSNPCLR